MTRATRAMLIWASILAGIALLAGCGPSIRTDTYNRPDGTPRLRQSYYVDSKGFERLHGLAKYWDEHGAVVAEGTWRDGKPWEGRCWIPAAGDAGSWGGLGTWHDYRDGQISSDER